MSKNGKVRDAGLVKPGSRQIIGFVSGLEGQLSFDADTLHKDTLHAWFISYRASIVLVLVPAFGDKSIHDTEKRRLSSDKCFGWLHRFRKE